MSRLQSVVRALEWPVAILALLIIPALVIEERATTPAYKTVAVIINWVVWVAFCVEFAVRWAADRKWSYLRRGWFDLLLIAVTPPFGVPAAMQGIRSVRVLRLLRLLRGLGVAAMMVRLAQLHFSRRKLHYVIGVAFVTVFVGALGVYSVEVGENRSITSFGDALWWAIVTATTVGYGDVSPVTAEGRVIAVALMLVGIGVIGIFTATVASFFVEQESGTDLAAIDARLRAIEQKLEEIARNQPAPAPERRAIVIDERKP